MFSADHVAKQQQMSMVCNANPRIRSLSGSQLYLLTGAQYSLNYIPSVFRRFKDFEPYMGGTAMDLLHNTESGVFKELLQVSMVSVKSSFLSKISDPSLGCRGLSCTQGITGDRAPSNRCPSTASCSNQGQSVDGYH